LGCSGRLGSPRDLEVPGLWTQRRGECAELDDGKEAAAGATKRSHRSSRQRQWAADNEWSPSGQSFEFRNCTAVDRPFVLARYGQRARHFGSSLLVNAVEGRVSFLCATGARAKRRLVERLSKFSADAPLLVLTQYHPYHAGGGLVILRSLVEAGDRDRLLWVTTAPQREIDDSYPPVMSLRNSTVGRRWPQRLAPLLDATIFPKSMARELLDIARQKNAKALWVVAHGSELPITVELLQLCRDAHLPMHVTVHDDPAFAVAAMSKKLRPLVGRTDRQFGRVLRAARSVDVIGKGMQSRYRERYGIDSEVAHRALDTVVDQRPNLDRRAVGLSVGILGNTYRYQQLPVLAEAVRLAAMRVGAKGRVIVYGQSFGDRLRAEVDGKIDVVVRGHVDEATAANQLSRDALVLYLNYPFTAAEKVLRETSFPTKLSTYVLCARPILVHAPPHSSTSELQLDEPAYARNWTDMNPARGADALSALWNAPDVESSFYLAAERTRRKYFDPEQNRATIARLLNNLI